MNRFIIFSITLLVFFIAACEQKKPAASQLQEVFPPVEIKYAALFRINNLPVTPIFFKNHWTIIAFGDADCGGPCLLRLKSLADIDNVQKLFFYEDLADHARLRELATEFPAIGMTSGTTASSAENFYRQFDVDFIEADNKKQFLYLVNPVAELEFAFHEQDLVSGQISEELARLKP
jgi:hypothetical protein